MRAAAVLLAFASLVPALPAAASDGATARSLTIRVYVTEVTQTIEDVPPKSLTLGYVYTKGDTVRGTESLRNAVRQFDKPKGADVGTDRYVIVGVALQKVRVDFVTTFPGGTVHARGEGTRPSKPEVPVVGGTGVYAGATGSIEGEHLANGKKLNIYRLRIPR
jgi:hypothetical protein